MNNAYGKLTNGEIEYAPSCLEVDGALKLNPSPESYLAAGWKHVIDNPPSGVGYVASMWTESADTITRVYRRYSMAPAPTRIISKLKLVIALKKRNLWVLVKTWLEEKGLYDFYLAAQAISEDNQYFIEGRDGLQEYTRKTDDEIEEIIAESVAS